MSQKKTKKRVIVETNDMLAGIQALTVFYEQKVQAFAAIREEFGDDDPVTMTIFEEVETLGNILNHFSNLVGDQLKGEGESFN